MIGNRRTISIRRITFVDAVRAYDFKDPFERVFDGLWFLLFPGYVVHLDFD